MGPRTSYRWSDGIEKSILSAITGKTSLWEMLCYFKADFLITPTKFVTPLVSTMMNKPGFVDNMKSTTTGVIDYNQVDLSEYDLIITHDPIITNIKEVKKRYPNTIFAYIAIEHSVWQVHQYGTHYDLYLDHTLWSEVEDVVRLPQAINFLFPRIPDTLRKLFPFKKESIFFDYRSIGYFVGEGSNNYGLSNEEVEEFYGKLPSEYKLERVSELSLQSYMFDVSKQKDSVEFYSKLSKTKYFISIANRVGQAAFDAASAGALVIGTNQSDLHCKLCHQDALMKEEFKLDDVLLKIKQFEENPDRYEKALKHQENFISLYCIEHPKKIFEQACKLKKS
jgi:hypothetical protein